MSSTEQKLFMATNFFDNCYLHTGPVITKESVLKISSKNIPAASFRWSHNVNILEFLQESHRLPNFEFIHPHCQHFNTCTSRKMQNNHESTYVDFHLLRALNLSK